MIIGDPSSSPFHRDFALHYKFSIGQHNLLMKISTRKLDIVNKSCWEVREQQRATSPIAFDRVSVDSSIRLHSTSGTVSTAVADRHI